MADKLNPKTVASTTAIMFGIGHTLGVIGILSGFMQYGQWAHFITIQYTVQPFNIVTLITGILVASLAGFLFGWLFATVYNSMAKMK